MKKVSPLDYTFAVGKIRALEKFLLKEEVFEQALGASLKEALRLFAESDLHSDELLHVENSEQLEVILHREKEQLTRDIRDLMLDKRLLCLVNFDNISDLHKSCNALSSDFLRNYLMYVIDMHNIKSFLRLYILKEPQEKLSEVLACEGFLKRKDLLTLYSQELMAFINSLEYVYKHYEIIDYAYYLGDAIQKTVKEKSFVALEKAINDFLMQELLPAKYITFGPEPIVAHYFARLNEINLIRMIVLAKLNDAPLDLVKARLNNVYA